MPSVVAHSSGQAGQDRRGQELPAHARRQRARDEPGTQAYVFHQKKDDPAVFVAYEKYESDEAFKQHGQNLRAQGAGFAAVLDGAPGDHPARRDLGRPQRPGGPGPARPLVGQPGEGVGGDERDRTADLCVANAALSQLSYIPDPERVP